MHNIHQQLLSSPTGHLWQKIGTHHHHGINIPLFSLKSQQSSGIGEFNDLIAIIDWCSSLGLDVIQLLPLNHTNNDNCPYNALSAFATDPIFLHVQSLPEIDQCPDIDHHLAALTQLNNLQRVNYDNVRHHKYSIFRKYFEHIRSTTLTTPEYNNFVKDNSWLNGYALFMTLKSIHYNQHWQQWPTELQNPSSQLIEELLQKHKNDVDFYSFLQYLCYQQFQKIKHYASSKKVLIKGDIPILISRDSADVWLHRSLFITEFSAGAPPDAYAADGQKWGFPIYNWEELANQDYLWWKERLKVAAQFYHLYRIDHIVGFFRIWAIPPGKTALEGSYIPEDKTVWIEHGTKILKMMLQTCPMLPIGEDLGTVPPKVRVALKQMGICGTKVMRWERDWDGNQHFLHADEYIPESMTTVSTHDSETLEQWWHNNHEEVQSFIAYKHWHYRHDLSQEYRESILYDSHHTASLFHINLLQEYLALIPDFTWPNLQDERINVPGTVSENNWSYRTRPTIEDFTSNSTLNNKIRQLIG